MLTMAKSDPAVFVRLYEAKQLPPAKTPEITPVA
jgi:hypothetical protein